MALTLALPLFGLDPEHFSALSMKLLNIEREQNMRNLSDSGRTSPSTGSESSGISSLATSAESASVELTPISSRPETPTRVPSKSQEKTVRVVYGGRDILNLGANIRPSFDWQMRDRTLSRHNIQDFITNRLVYHRLREQPLTKDYLTSYRTPMVKILSYRNVATNVNFANRHLSSDIDLTVTKRLTTTSPAYNVMDN